MPQDPILIINAPIVVGLRAARDVSNVEAVSRELLRLNPKPYSLKLDMRETQNTKPLNPKPLNPKYADRSPAACSHPFCFFIPRLC